MKTLTTQPYPRGFTLIEVLLTIVLIGIGLLGLATLQVTSLNNQMEAYQRTQALMMLEDMANRIRSNSAAATARACSGLRPGRGSGSGLKSTGSGRLILGGSGVISFPESSNCKLITPPPKSTCVEMVSRP